MARRQKPARHHVRRPLPHGVAKGARAQNSAQSHTKAAYRVFSNGSVSEDKILEGHFAASALRIRATDGPILILQDTAEFAFKRAAPEKIGFTKVSTGRKLKEGRHQKHAVCGLLMHASLEVTPDGLPLGLTAAKGSMSADLSDYRSV